MRTCGLLFAFFLLCSGVHAQTVSTFDTLTLHGSDTEYVNYSSLGADVGFNDGLAYFPCVYDTSYGDSMWMGGFAYSNWSDSTSSPDWADSVSNRPVLQYAAKTGGGYGGSAKYAVVYCNNPVTYASVVNMKLTGPAQGQPVSGFYATNTSYAWSSMKYGDQFDSAFHTGDWFLLTIKAYHGGVLGTDSVNFYLADYRFAHADSDYILNTWQWVNLLPLGHADSLQFALSSSNTTGGYLDVPSYFCMDNFTTNETGLSVSNTQPGYMAKVYPNPASSVLYVELADKEVQQLAVLDRTGRELMTCTVTTGQAEVNIATLPAGVYELVLQGNGKGGTVRFVKQ